MPSVAEPLGLMVRSVAQRRVSNHGSRFGLATILRDALASLGLLRMRSESWRDYGLRRTESLGLMSEWDRSQKDLDRLFLGVAQQLRQTAFLADAGILVAAIGRALEVVAHA